MRSNWQQTSPGDSYREDFAGSGSGGGGGGLQLAMPPLTPVVKGLIIANVAVFIACFMLSFSNEAWVFVRHVFGVTPALWREWFPILPVWQLLSWGFLHSASDLFHILMNMLFLYFLGTMLERIIGGRRFLIMYIGALVCSGLVTLVIGLAMGPATLTAPLVLTQENFEVLPTLGASGAVLAVVVATATLRPTTRVIFMIFPITLRTLAIIFVGLDAFGALSSMKPGAGASGVAYTAHLAGAAFGFLIVWRGWIWKDPLAGLNRWRETRVEETAVRDAGRIDRLLEQINREGIHSLSGADRAFLKRASKRR